jgi:DNA (cytosine-5)-methyltransferase 1
MDTTEITHLSLCSGYGGLDLGIKGVFGENVRTVAYAEIEAFAIECLLARMEGGQLDAAPIWPNLKSFPWQAFSDRVDILSGGYPCQPFSAAGKRLGTEDPRHLWPFIANGIRIMRPKFCFFENVEGHISLGLREVVGELESMGYQVSWGIFSAREVGAPHQRKRVFILAYRNNSGSGENQLLSKLRTARIEQSSRGLRLCGEPTQVEEKTVWPSRPGQPQHKWEPPRVVGNTRDKGYTGSKGEGRAREEGESNGYASESTNDERRKAQPSLGRDFDGTASGMDYAELCVSCDNRHDELRLLGNGVVPATATKAFLTLLEDLIK